MTITGTIPSAIAAFLKTEDESLNGIEIKGNDIDVILTDKRTYTELYAIGMGNGSYEIIEIDDNLNLLPEYSEGDVISNDVLKKLFSTVINSSLDKSIEYNYDYDCLDILSTLSKYADYKEIGVDSARNPTYEIKWKSLYSEDECRVYAEGMEDIYDINFSEDLSKMWISKDVPKDLFNIDSSLILSFNPLGKVKYGIVDKVKDVTDKTKKGVNKIKEAGKWVADIIEPQDAQNWIRQQKGFERAKVGKVERIGGVTGGYYAVLAGNPADKKFSVWKLYRNGNEYRTLNVDFYEDSQEALDSYNTLTGISDEDPYEANNEGVVEPEYKDTEEVEQTEEADNLNDVPDEEDNVYDEEGLKYAKKADNTRKGKRKFKRANKSKEGWQTNDEGVEYKVVAALKKKKKKSKYNGCNVTGYEDGTLISPMSVGDGGMATGM